MAEVQIAPETVLAASGEAASTIFIADDAARRRVEFGQRIAEADKAKIVSTGGKSAFESLGRNPESNSLRAGIEDMRTKFGAGEARLGKGGKITEPKDREAKGIFNESNSHIDTITTFLDYSSIKAEEAKGKPIDEILKERNIKTASGDADLARWDKMRDSVIDNIYNINNFADTFSYLGSLPDFIRKDHIEKMLATDPQLQKKITGKMEALLTEVGKLQEVKGATPDEINKSRSNRLRAEGKINDKLGDVMGDSVREVLTERTDAIAKTNSEVLQKEEDAQLKKVADTMDKRWITYDRSTRTRTSNNDNIGEDVRDLIYFDDGLDRLILRDLGVEMKDDMGMVTTDWKQADLTKLSASDAEIFTKAKAKFGAEYQKKLLSDFSQARITEVAKGKWYKKADIPDELKLKDHEWTKFNRKFAAPLEEDLKKMPGGTKMIEELKKSGFDSKKESEKGSILLSILLAISAGVAFAGIEGIKEGIKTASSDQLR